MIPFLRSNGRRPATLPAFLTAMFVAVALGPHANADTLSGKALVDALRAGGHTIYFRHTQTDWNQNDRVERDGDWTSCDGARMRQLSNEGRATARRIGEAMRALGVPVGEVLSSEYCRAVETARNLDVGEVKPTRDIMNLRAAAFVGGRDEATERARRVIAMPPPEGANRVIAAHGNLMRATTGDYAGEGGAGIYRPDEDAERGFVRVAELTPEDWQRLAAEFGRAD